MKHVDEYPVLCEFIAITSVHVDHTHMYSPVRRGKPHKSTAWRHRQVRPAEPASVMTLGKTTYVPIENDIVETLPEWPLMLAQESVDRVSRSYSTGAKPGHVVVPRFGQSFGRNVGSVCCHKVILHPVNKLPTFRGLCHVLYFEEQSIMRSRPWINEFSASLYRQRC